MKMLALLEKVTLVGEVGVTNQCHIKGKDRRAAHQSCNLNVKKCQSSFVPLSFHKLSESDSHFFNQNNSHTSYSNIKNKPLPTNQKLSSVKYRCLKLIH